MASGGVRRLQAAFASATVDGVTGGGCRERGYSRVREPSGGGCQAGTGTFFITHAQCVMKTVGRMNRPVRNCSHA